MDTFNLTIYSIGAEDFFPNTTGIRFMGHKNHGTQSTNIILGQVLLTKSQYKQWCVSAAVKTAVLKLHSERTIHFMNSSNSTKFP